MFQNGTLGGLALAASLWATAVAGAAAAQEPAPAMPLGSVALPPEGYVSFCQRQPWDCGAAPKEVLARADRAEAERAALFAAASAVALGAQPGGETATVLTPAVATTQAVTRQALATPASTTAAATPAAALMPVKLVAAPAAAPEAPEAAAAPEAAPAGPAPMNHRLWATLNRVNDEVNGAIYEATDLVTYGKDDYWSTPLEDGVRSGDCEDFVLEKQRALLAAGLPREDLNIAVVVTPWGESHAVLLVNTTEGELVLDNLTGWIKPWQKTNYRWRQREVGGDAFTWKMVADPSRRAQPLGSAIVASVR